MTDTKDDSTLISFRPQSDFEKLIFAEDQVRTLTKELSELKVQYGQICSHNQELEDKLKTVHQDTINQLATEDQKSLMLKLHKYKEKEKNRDTRVADLRKTIEQLVTKCARLQKTPQFWAQLLKDWENYHTANPNLTYLQVYEWFKKQLT